MGSFPMLFVGFLSLVLLSVFLYRRGRHILASLFLSAALAPACYVTIGIWVPRLTNEGRFYSFPVGGLSVGDTEIMLSVLLWVGAWLAILSITRLTYKRLANR